MTEPLESTSNPVGVAGLEATRPPLVSVRGISKQFPGTQALDRVDFDVLPGEIHALVGENGAGKSTLIKTLAGVYQADAGEIQITGRPLAELERAPISFIHQDLGLVASMTVAENIALVTGYPRRASGLISWREVREPAAAIRQGVAFVSSRRAEESLASNLTVRENVYPNPVRHGTPLLGWISKSDEHRRIVHTLERFNIRPRDPERMVGTLSGGNQQKTVIARWLEADSRLLVLEEPTTGVDVGSKAEISHLLAQEVGRGSGVLLVSSDFEEVAGICHRALVMRRGRVVAEVPRDRLSVERLTELASGATDGESGVERRERGGSHRTDSRAGELGRVRALSAYGLFALLLLLLIGFSLLLPNTFPTPFNLRSILSDKSVIALLALAEMVPIATSQFDLSIGYHIGLAHILVVGLQVNQHLPWPVAVVFVLAIGALVGLINGLLVTRAQIDAFIASLGVGTILFGIAFWYAPVQVVGQMAPEFRGLAGNPGGVPLPFVYVVVISAALFVVFEYLPLGRYLYVLGSSQRAAELTGISARRYIPLAFMLSGVITAFAGVVLGAKLGVAQTTVGPDYLLPAFVGALLGSTSIRPGRVNVLGTLVAVFVLAVAVAGLQQLGAQYFVEPLFNGSMLVLSVGLAAAPSS